MRMRTLAAATLLAAALIVATAAKAASYAATVFASNLNNPRGLAFDASGALYIAESGYATGGVGPSFTASDGSTVRFDASASITRVFGGSQDRIVTGLPALVNEASGGATGAQDIAFGADGTGYVVIGLGAPPSVRTGVLGSVSDASSLGRVFTFTNGGAVTSFADVSAFEGTTDRDGAGFDSNPFHLAATGGGLFVTDAGANTLLKLAADGTVAGFNVVPGPAAGIQSVPTGVAIGPDGTPYVGELTGGPFPEGGASIFRVVPDETTPDPNDSTLVTYLGGFTMISDFAFGPDGTLYVLEVDSNGLVAPGGSGTLIRVASDGTREVMIDGLVAPTGLAIGSDGAAYVTNRSPLAGIGQVLRVAAIPEPASWSMMILGFGLVGFRLRRASRAPWPRDRRFSPSAPRPAP